MTKQDPSAVSAHGEPRDEPVGEGEGEEVGGEDVDEEGDIASGSGWATRREREGGASTPGKVRRRSREIVTHSARCTCRVCESKENERRSGLEKSVERDGTNACESFPESELDPAGLNELLDGRCTQRDP